MIRDMAARARSCTALALVVAITALLIRRALLPPPPRLPGSPGGPPVSSPRIQLDDGRFLAYKESGYSPRHLAQHKVVFVHGFYSTKDSMPDFSQDLLNEHRIAVVSFDRAGYGESDPNPHRSIKSEAYDIEQLADKLQFGPKFYVLGLSIGGYSAWGCIKYIPHRLSGVGMIVPVTNFWWSGVTPEEFKLAMSTQVPGDRWFLTVTHYLPWLSYWWMTQRFFPTSTAVQTRVDVFCASDREALQSYRSFMIEIGRNATQQGIAESLVRDAVIMFGKWEFDPGDLQDPADFSVHIWQGVEDYLVPLVLQRYVHRRAPWIHYTELKGQGHFLRGVDGFVDNVLKALIQREDVPAQQVS